MALWDPLFHQPAGLLTPRRECRPWRFLSSSVLCAFSMSCAQAREVSPLASMSLEDLDKVQVTSVTGRPSSAQEAAASVYVIRAEDIRRSTATSLPEALRLAPNLEVARQSAGQYAISARGFNNTIGNKLLVLIDGRIVYSPLFSGVFWDAQDVNLDEVDRIEVISGPGATLWGANAVNGVINIITRNASESPGAYLQATGGKTGSNGTARYGGLLGDQGSYRIYASRWRRDNTRRQDGSELPDASSKNQVGFRSDWSLSDDQFTLQGDAYTAGNKTASNLAPEMSGANLVARWSKRLSDGGTWTLQTSFDRTRRDDDLTFKENTRNWAVDTSYVPSISPTHNLIIGAGYRESTSEANPTVFFRFDPEVRQLRWANVFVQDEIRVTDPLRVTLGAKVETNVYTGAEFLPTLRGAYKLGEHNLFWASLSRAVRAPARLDRDLFLPGTPPYQITGGPNFQSEVAVVTELGYRTQPAANLNLSVTAFHHSYTRLRAGRGAPTEIENRASGSTRGIEAWGTAQLLPSWRVSAGLLELRKSLTASPGSGANSVANLGNDPEHQWSLRSNLDLGPRVELDVALRRVSALPTPYVPAYTAADLRVGWRVTDNFDVTLLVQNALDPRHAEGDATEAASQVRRSVFVKLEWRTF